MVNKKTTISEDTITLTMADFSRILRAAVHCDYLMEQKRIDETKIANMRKELTRYHTICENRKRTSGAGASVEPQQTTTNADETKTDAGALTIQTEGRVSGGERAGFIDIEREHYKRLEDKYIAVSKERDETKARLASAERCIEDCFGVIDRAKNYHDSYDKRIEHIIRAWREQKEAAR